MIARWADVTDYRFEFYDKSQLTMTGKVLEDREDVAADMIGSSFTWNGTRGAVTIRDDDSVFSDASDSSQQVLIDALTADGRLLPSGSQIELAYGLTLWADSKKYTDIYVLTRSGSSDVLGFVSLLRIAPNVSYTVQAGWADANPSFSQLALALNGVIEGTASDDTINNSYNGDPQGDRVDGLDNTGEMGGTAGSNDDYITAFGGNDRVDAGDGNDTVYGGDGDDGLYGAAGDDRLYGDAGNDQINGGDGNDSLYGRSGNDMLDGGSGRNEIYGGDGDDSIWGGGGSGTNLIYGGAGQDKIFGEHGNETIFGDDGNDSVEGNNGNDWIYGGFGDDYLHGGEGHDSVSGDGGNDTLIGGIGDDTLDGGENDDLLLGEDGNDELRGGDGHDRLEGGGGADKLYGGNGNDALYGGNQNDTIEGGAGADLIYGGGNEDRIDGGDGDDQIYGDQGHDTILGGAGNDTIDGGDGNDSLAGGLGEDSLLGGFGNDTISGDDGNDRLFGDAGADQLFGGAGEDYLSGGDQDDFLAGGDGHDTLDGGTGNDTLQGGAGNDWLYGGQGSDTLSGGDGNDRLDGGEGTDRLVGGAGADTFIAGHGDTITDFEAAADLINLSAIYSIENLAVINQIRIGQGLKPFLHPMQWLKSDQADGVLTDIRLARGFDRDFTMNIHQGGNDTALGTAVAAADLSLRNTMVKCFAAETLITTKDGPVAAGDLVTGQLVWTRDDGFQPIRWIGQQRLSRADLAGQPKLRPIRIAPGALGRHCPERELIVSPQHRILLRSKIAERMFSSREILAPAKHLCGIEGISVASDLDEITYVHFIFDRHQLVNSNGALSESLYPGPEAMKTMDADALAELIEIFPGLALAELPTPARLTLPGRQIRKLLDRHLRNNRALVDIDLPP